MQLPRIRFTVRRMMIAIALFAVVLVVGMPLSRSLIWLYHAPMSFSGLMCNLNPWTNRIRKPISAGETIRFDYPYTCDIGSNIPPWLPYWARIEVKIIDEATGDIITGTAVTTAYNRHLLMNGLGSWGKADGKLEFEMKPPHPGHYIVRYEAHVTDLFGRSGMAACDTAGFRAR